MKKLFMNMRIVSKLAVGFSALIVMILILAGLGLYNFHAISIQMKIYDKVTSAQEMTVMARVEQVRYENEGRDETAQLVTKNLENAVLELTEAQQLMQSETNREKVKEAISKLDTYETEFKNYMELENQKNKSNQDRIQLADATMEAIDTFMKREEVFIHTITDVGTLNESFSKYVKMKSILDDFVEAKFNTYIYREEATKENGEKVVEYLQMVQQQMESLLPEIKDKETLADMEAARSQIESYLDIFTKYEQVLLDQEQTKATMKDNAVQSTAINVEIEEGVLSFVEQLESRSNRIGIFAGIFAVLFSGAVGFLVTRSITVPLHKASDMINSIASYDLTKQLEVGLMERKDEIGVLGKSLNKIISNLRAIIEAITESSSVLAASSEELSATSHSSTYSANEIARAIQEIAEGANLQAKNTDTGVTNVNELGELIEKDRASVNDLTKAAEYVETLQNEGLSIVESLVKETEKNIEATEAVYQIVQDTNTSVEKIESISQMIQSIAKQTNLLALNAAIEAARAGEAGQGFTIVSEEIRKLAEQSAQFTSDIQLTVKDLIVKASDGVAYMKINSELAQSQSKSVQNTSEKFKGISKAIDTMKVAIEDILHSSNMMEAKKLQIIDLINELSSVSEENAAGTEQAAASVEEQTVMMEQISESSEDLAKIAEMMQGKVAKFILS